MNRADVAVPRVGRAALAVDLFCIRLMKNQRTDGARVRQPPCMARIFISAFIRAQEPGGRIVR